MQTRPERQGRTRTRESRPNNRRPTVDPKTWGRNRLDYSNRLRDAQAQGKRNAVTEMRGEIAAQRYMRHNFPEYRQVRGYTGANRPGFDQVYVRDATATRPAHYIVVEAKGGNARLGTTKTMGRQMSPTWVQGNAQKLSNDPTATPDQRALGQTLSNALNPNTTDPARVSGLVVRGRDGRYPTARPMIEYNSP